MPAWKEHKLRVKRHCVVDNILKSIEEGKIVEIFLENMQQLRGRKNTRGTNKKNAEYFTDSNVSLGTTFTDQ